MMSPSSVSATGGMMIIDYEDIRQVIPGWILNEYGQLTGNYVHYDQIVCVIEDGRLQIWLNREAYEARDPELLICDYTARDVLGQDETRWPRRHEA
jgi:hypothetical protein